MSQQGVPRDTYTGRIEFKFSNIVKVRLPNQLPNFDTHDLAVDRTVICRSSEVMRKTFSNSQDNKATVTLARITPFDFTLYLNWLYTGILRTKCSQEDIAYGIDDEYESFIDGYLMGIELEDREYRNVMISALFEKAQELPRPDLPRPAWVNKVYDPNVASQEIVTLQYVLLEIFARCNDTASLYDAVGKREFHNDFVRDLVVQLARRSQALPPVDVCTFHTHEGGDKCSTQESARKRRQGT